MPLEPAQAALELARLPRGDKHEPEAAVRERAQACVCAWYRRRALEVVCQPEFLDFADCLVGVAPVWVLRVGGTAGAGGGRDGGVSAWKRGVGEREPTIQ